MPKTPDPLSPRYFALLYSPPERRSALEAVLGIEREVFESLRPGLDHHIAHTRLQWWREECERTAAGRPVHPLTRGLLESAPGSRPVNLQGIVDVAVWDLASATFETGRELDAYRERWAAAMMEPLGAPVPLGAAIREIELLANLGRDARRGRIRLPLDELERVTATPGVLVEDPWPEAVIALVRSRHASARAELARAIRSLEGGQRRQLRGILVWAALVDRSMDRNARALPDRRSPRRVDGMADTWLAWRTARKAARGELDSLVSDWER
jgi:phytoene synthase